MRERNKPLGLVPALHRATHRVGLHIQARHPGVSQGEAHILAQLASEGPCTIARLHAAFAHRRSTLTSILDRMSEQKLIRRTLRPEDRRSFLVSPTPRGRVRARQVHATLAALEAAVARRVSRADLRGYVAVVKAIADEARPAVKRL